VGVSMMGRSSDCTRKSDNVSPNPNPLSYKIVTERIVGGRSILLVKYFGCTTFAGYKLLLLNKVWTGSSFAPALDPHLLGGKHPVLARFEPTEQGWALATLCASALATGKR